LAQAFSDLSSSLKILKTWSNDNPKAPLMEQKRAAIVVAARQAFLDNGYAESSMDRIAESAAVSVKTIYRHFENKDELFSAVMQAACQADSSIPAARDDTASPAARFSWFAEAPKRGLAAAGRDYLHHLLSEEQLALYRVVTRDAHRFPELGRRYEKEVAAARNNIMAQYLTRWAPIENWKIKNPDRASGVFAALLREGMFDEVLHGLRAPEEAKIEQQARFAAGLFGKLLQLGVF
jgi:AcrR family transcriptional regulator